MVSRNFRSFIFPALITLALLSIPAYSATITTFTTSNSWQLALSNFQSIDFGGLAPTNGYTSYPGGFTVNGVQFLGLGGSAIQVLDTGFSSWYNFGTGDAADVLMDRADSNAPLPYIHVILPTPVTAVGFNLFSVQPSALSYNITAAGGTYAAPTFALPTPAFFGMTSDTPFSSVDIVVQGSSWNDATRAFVDNFSYGTANAGTGGTGGTGDTGDVPESSTCVLFGAGLTSLGLLRRRRQKLSV